MTSSLLQSKVLLATTILLSYQASASASAYAQHAASNVVATSMGNFVGRSASNEGILSSSDDLNDVNNVGKIELLRKTQEKQPKTIIGYHGVNYNSQSHHSDSHSNEHNNSHRMLQDGDDTNSNDDDNDVNTSSTTSTAATTTATNKEATDDNVDDDGALPSDDDDAGNDDTTNVGENGNNNDDDEWYLPENEIVPPTIMAFGSGSLQDWGVVFTISDGDVDDTTTSDAIDIDAPNLFDESNNNNNDDDESSNQQQQQQREEEIFYSHPIPIAHTLTPPRLEEGDSLVDIAAGNVHSGILTQFGRVYTAGSWGLEEDMGLGRSLLEEDYDLTYWDEYLAGLESAAAAGGSVSDAGSSGGENDDDGDDATPSNDDATNAGDDDDDVFTNNTTTTTSTTSSTSSTRPSRYTSTTTTTTSTTTTTKGATSNIAAPPTNIIPTAYSFQPITEIYSFISNTYILETLSSNNNNNNMKNFPKFTQIKTSQYFTFLLDREGNVYATGMNSHGQLCLNDTDSRERFYQIPPSFINDVDGSGGNGDDLRIVDVALGERHTLLLRNDGKVLACGWNVYGQLGIGTKGGNNFMPSLVVVDQPDEVDAGDDGDGDDAVTVMDGNSNSTNATKQNSGNETNSTTSTSTSSVTSSPVPVTPIDTSTVTQIAAGRGSSYFRTSSGHVFAVGTNYEGQLCLGHREDRTLPTLLTTIDYSSSPEGTMAVQSIAAGKSSLYLQMEDGSVTSCGSNAHGQLGGGSLDEDSRVEPLPVLIEDDGGMLMNVTRIFSGPVAFNAFFLTANGTIYGAGYNGAGQLGVGDQTNRNAAAVVACSDVELVGGERSIWTPEMMEERTVISSGNDHALFLGRPGTFVGCHSEDISFPESSPESTLAPTSSMAPSASSMPSVTPTVSSAPSSSQMPSLAPSISLIPTTTPKPTDLSDWPTLSPTMDRLSSPPTLALQDAVSGDTAGGGGGGGEGGNDRSVSGAPKVVGGYGCYASVLSYALAIFFFS